MMQHFHSMESFAASREPQEHADAFTFCLLPCAIFQLFTVVSLSIASINIASRDAPGKLLSMWRFCARQQRKAFFAKIALVLPCVKMGPANPLE